MNITAEGNITFREVKNITHVEVVNITAEGNITFHEVKNITLQSKT